MIFRTLLFLLLMYLLVKFISRLFLSSKKEQQKRSGIGAFYRTFQQFAEQNRQQNQQPNNKRRRQQSGSGSQRFEEIEEAEFEDITDDEKRASK